MHTLAIKTDGTLWAWGTNTDAQLGDGTTTNKYTPTQIGTSTNWKMITAGSSHSLAIKTDATLWGWGNNTAGQLGDGTTSMRFHPTQIDSSTNWKIISNVRSHSMSLKTDAILWTWGSNSFAQLGDGTTVNKNNPTFIPTSCSIVTNLPTINNNSLFKLYPNPGNGEFIIELRTKASISVFNLIGECVYFSELNEGNHFIDIHNQPSGIYLIKLSDNQQSFKFIKN